MAKLKIVTVEGYSKDEAIANSGLNLDVKFDATTAWKKEETPEAGSTYFKAFAENYLNKKFKGVPGIGCAVTVSTGVADSRERPYKVKNHVTEGARKYKTVYVGLTDYDSKNFGTIVLKADTKGEAEDLAKTYTTTNKKNVRVVNMKEVVEGKAVALDVEYAPSINTTLGRYVIFGYEAE